MQAGEAGIVGWMGCSDTHQLWLTMGIAMSNPSFRAAEPQARPSELTKYEIGGFRVIRQRSNVFHPAAQDKFDLSGGAVTTTNPDGYNVNPPIFPYFMRFTALSARSATFGCDRF